MKTGTLKWYDPKKQYGFIIDPEMRKDIFFHQKNLHPDCKESFLKEGVSVSYNLTAVKKGYEGSDVLIIGDSDGKYRRNITEKDIFGRKIERFEVDETNESDNEGIFIKAIVLEGGIRLPLIIDEETDSIFLSFDPHADSEE